MMNGGDENKTSIAIDVMEGRDIRKELQPDAVDGSLTVSKSLLGLVPLVGPTLAELVSASFNAPLSRRKDEWMVYFADGIRELKAHVEDIDTADYWQAKMNDPAFFSLFLEASLIAVRTHREEKREALRNAVLNTALDIDVEEEARFRYLRLIDQFSPSHLDVLSFAVCPKEWLEKRGLPEPFAFTDFDAVERVRKTVRALPFYDLVWRELAAQHLVDGEIVSHIESSLGLHPYRSNHATHLGKQFHGFIQNPSVLEETITP